jgi:hypothetical protein
VIRLFFRATAIGYLSDLVDASRVLVNGRHYRFLDPILLLLPPAFFGVIVAPFGYMRAISLTNALEGFAEAVLAFIFCLPTKTVL